MWQYFSKNLKFVPKATTLSISILAIAVFGTACIPSRDTFSVTPPSNAQLPKVSTQSPTSTAKKTGNEQAPINIAVISWQVSAEQDKKLLSLADYLSQALKRPFKFQIAKDYASAIDSLIKGKVELAYLAPSAYIEARRRNSKVEPLVTPINKETKRPWDTAVIIANKASGIETLQDLKGKRFAFVNKLSTSGYIVPMAYFLDMGIHPERDFRSVIFSGSYNKSKEALAQGKVDAIADERRSYNEQVKSGKLELTKHTIMWESVPFPSVSIVASAQLSGELKEELKKVLIHAPEGLIDPTGAVGAGYTLVHDADYDIVREFQRRVLDK